MPVPRPPAELLPHLQALSASSPIWAGIDTGYASNRALMFQQLRPPGCPSSSKWSEFESFVQDEVVTGVIEELTEIAGTSGPRSRTGPWRTGSATGSPTSPSSGRWSRSCTAWSSTSTPGWLPGDPADDAALALQENKRRAARYGLDAIVITDAASNERLVTDDLADLLERLPGGRPARLLRRARRRRRHPAPGRPPAAARRRGGQRRRPGRGRRLGGARAAGRAGLIAGPPLLSSGGSRHGSV